MQFLAHFFQWQCTACATPCTRVQVGVSALGELLATWWCAKCKQRVMATIPLEEVIAKVPSLKEQTKLLEAPKDELTSEDEKLLKEARIRWND